MAEPAMNGNVKPFVVEFRDSITLIVGENGSGKSTMLKYMSDRKAAKRDGVTDKMVISEESKNVRSMYFDTEKNNPRINRPASFNAVDVMNHLNGNMQSHGETLFPILEYVGQMQNAVVLVDEPESGISLSNQKKLWEAFSAAAANGCQLVIATHSYLFIQWAGEVFDMSSGKYVSSERYIESALAGKRKRGKT